MKLTPESIQKLVYSKSNNKQDIYWDDKLSGFGVRVYPTGHKTYVATYRVKGKKQIKTLGAITEITLEEARVRAAKLLQSIKFVSEPLPRTASVRFGEFYQIYLKRRVLRMRSGAEEKRRIEKHLLPRFQNRSLHSITTDEIESLHADITQRGPIEANRVIQIVNRMINRAKEWNYLPPEFQNPTQTVIEHPERKRDRWVNREEMPRLLQAINKVPNEYVRAALWLYLLTGARKTELIKAEWRYLDTELSQLRLIDTKNGTDFYLTLSPTALGILKSLPRVPGNPFIFVGKKSGRHLVNFEKTWKSVKRDAHVDDVTIHDLRRTFGSWLAQAGHSLELIGKTLNHKDGSATVIYARHDTRQIKAAVKAFDETLSEIISPTLGRQKRRPNNV
jgi:integrase